MSTDLTVIPPVDTEDFFDRAATIYLDLWDANGHAPKIDEVIQSLPDGYPETMVAMLKTKQWHEYLAGRRKEHLITTMASRLMAAQAGASMGDLAGRELVARLKANPSALSTKDLVSIMKQGYEFAHKIDKDMEEIKGDKPQVYIDMRSIVTQMDAERQFDMLQEIARRFREKNVLDVPAE